MALRDRSRHLAVPNPQEVGNGVEISSAARNPIFYPLHACHPEQREGPVGEMLDFGILDAGLFGI